MVISHMTDHIFVSKNLKSTCDWLSDARLQVMIEQSEKGPTAIFQNLVKP